MKLLHSEIARRIFETMPDMLAVLDENGKILECNHHLEQNTGYAKKDLIGIIGPIELVDERDRKKAMQAFEQIKTNGLNLNVPLFMKRKDGSVFPSIWSGSTLPDEDNGISGYLVTGKVLSEIYELKEELEKEKAKRLMTIGELTLRFSHDIRNPLSTIRNAVELLKLRNTITDTKELSLIDMIDKSALRISNQIQDVLDFVRSSNIEKESCSIVQILNSCIGKTILPDNVKINMPIEDLHVDCDKVKVEIVFENIIINAIQAIDTNQGTITIKIKNEINDNVIEISDSGPGIPPEILPKIFDSLFTTKRSGTGLGLPTCKNLIELHGWTIEVKLPSTFVIRIPRRLKNLE